MRSLLIHGASTIERFRHRAFIFLLWLPMLLICITRDPRFPLPRSAGELLLFPGEFKHYFSNHFPLRDSLAGLHNRALLRLDGPTEVGPVTLGRNGWLFLRLSRDRVDESIGYRHLLELRDEYERRAAFCRQHGISYRVLVVPAKSNVYSEHLPERFSNLIPDHDFITRSGRFLKTKGRNFRSVDVLARFRAEKARAPLYFKTDSHWTEFGGYLATDELMKSLSETKPPVAPPAISFRMETCAGGNEAQILGLKKRTRETYPRVIVADGRNPRLRDGGPLKVNTINLSGFESSVMETRCPEAPGRTVVVFHNSFGVALVPFLGRRFRECAFVWREFDQAEVARRRPDVVVDLMTTL